MAGSVLANPLRARLAELKAQGMSPPELAEALGKSLPVVAYHWRVLEQARAPGLPGGS